MTSKTLRIVHLVRSPVGGIFRHIADLAEAQADTGHEVGFVCDSLTIGPFEDAKIAALAPRLSLGAHRIPIARHVAPSDITALSRVHGLLSPLAPDVVHAHGAKGGVFGRLVGAWLGRARPVARIYAPHGGSLHYDAGSLEGRIYFRVERALERLTDAMIHVSAYEANAYVEKVGAPRCRTAVVRNGLAPDEFDPVAPDADATDFLYLGMLRDLKGVDVFIEALARLKAEGRAASATIVGDGPDEARYRATVAERGLSELVRFAPSTPARRAFAMGRAIVVPSRAESMPYVVLESIAAGLPIVSTAAGGIPEIFGPYADALVTPGDSAALGDAMAEGLRDPAAAKTQARLLRDHIGDEFSRAGMAARVETVYRDALRAKSV
ncbi:glycosyltransferase family 4 protein [Methylopila musalis]|uniref:Glycosyltransferase family 4 protein n=1 Tax=Methylopila musalis TaxID=1134781 RepID=A0ABW3Z3V8_9HYPH